MNDSDPPKLDASQSEERWRRFAKLPRPFQFSVRTLLVVTLVLGVFFGWLGSRLPRARNNRQARAEIRSLGGEPRGSGSRSWLDGLFHDPGAVCRVKGGSKFGDAGLEYMKELPNLEELHVFDLHSYNAQVTDAGLEHLKGLTDLEWLVLENTQVSGEGVEELQKALPNCKIHY